MLILNLHFLNFECLKLVQTCTIRCVKHSKIEIFLIQSILRTLPKQASPLRCTWPGPLVTTKEALKAKNNRGHHLQEF